MGEGMHVSRQRVYGNPLCFSLSFTVNLKLFKKQFIINSKQKKMDVLTEILLVQSDRIVIYFYFYSSECGRSKAPHHSFFPGRTAELCFSQCPYFR